MGGNDAAWGDLLDDAEYVLGELARGEIPCMAAPGVVAASDKLLDAVNLARANPASRDALGKVEKTLAATMFLLSPITVKTLRDTDGSLASAPEVERGHLSPIAWLSRRIFGDRPIAFRFSTAFSVLTVLIVISALVCGLLDHQVTVQNDHRWPIHHGPTSAGTNSNAGTNADTGTAANDSKAPSQAVARPAPPPPDIYSEIAHALAPFAYGAMGACVFLLRSLHKHIWGRTFDRRRKPEYYSRVMLGAISGGAIVLLLTSDVGSGAVKLGYNALGFLAGYNTDLLFSTIERIMNAIFPKSVAPATPAQAILRALPQTGSRPPSGGDTTGAGDLHGDAADKGAASDTPSGSGNAAPGGQAEPGEGEKAPSDVPSLPSPPDSDPASPPR
jgi:hypothetical protein